MVHSFQLSGKRIAALMTRTLSAVILTFGLTAVSQAMPITGTPQGNGFGWVAPSTNELNYLQMTPGYIGNVTPHVLFNANTIGSVTLDFIGPFAGISFFEIRIDGVATGATAHPVVTGDTIHSGGVFVDINDSTTQTFTATSFVDVRLALGGERDFDFDWTRFEVLSASVPEPTTLALFGLGLAGVGISRRKTA